MLFFCPGGQIRVREWGIKCMKWKFGWNRKLLWKLSKDRRWLVRLNNNMIGARRLVWGPVYRQHRHPAPHSGGRNLSSVFISSLLPGFWLLKTLSSTRSPSLSVFLALPRAIVSLLTVSACTVHWCPSRPLTPPLPPPALLPPRQTPPLSPPTPHPPTLWLPRALTLAKCLTAH